MTVADLNRDGKETTVNAKFVFIGAGGASLTLLQKSGIPEADGYGGFPVGGQFWSPPTRRSPTSTWPKCMARPA